MNDSDNPSEKRRAVPQHEELHSSSRPGVQSSVEEVFHPLDESKLILGEPWLRRSVSDEVYFALSSFRGIGDKYGENQDRAFFTNQSDGTLVFGVIDGMGGHRGGERAAELARLVIEEAIDSGRSLGVAIEEANRMVSYDNDQKSRLDLSTRSGAVLACATVRPDGIYESRTVQDSENFLISFPIDGGMPRIDYWSTRPTHIQQSAYGLPLMSDGRLPWGWERVIRLDPQSATVEAGLGLLEGSIFQNVDTIALETGRIYVSLSATDGLTEQFAHHGELISALCLPIFRTGDFSPAAIAQSVMEEALLRAAFAYKNYVAGVPIQITESCYHEAYGRMSKELYGISKMPAALEWPYLSREDQHFWLVQDYLVQGDQNNPSLNAYNPTQQRLIRNPAFGTLPEVVGRFKEDNISAVVAVFQKTT